jgi:hypothetical protein
MAVAPYEDGFLLSEVPMGEGFLDLETMVDMLRQKDPNIVFDLEMITRDLKVPIYVPGFPLSGFTRVSIQTVPFGPQPYLRLFSAWKMVGLIPSSVSSGRYREMSPCFTCAM